MSPESARRARHDLTIGERIVGPGRPCFVIAEAGINHDGDVETARRLIDAAAEAGADAVKFQTYRAELVVAASAPKAAYQIETTGRSESQLDMVRGCELSFDDFRGLRDHAQRRGIAFLSTPFDPESLEFLVTLGVPAIKVPSGEVTNLPFLRLVARTGLPVILSTGMADLDEVKVAVGVLRGHGCGPLVVLHCVSSYPAAPADANLRAMHTMARELDVPVGYSDHTLGLAVALASVALGACVLEKHFTLDRSRPGPDHRASLEPGELRALVEGVRAVESSLGDGRKAMRQAEADTRRVARRSLFLARELPAGAVVEAGDLVALRPAGGIPPADLAEVCGRRLARPLPAGHMLRKLDLA